MEQEPPKPHGRKSLRAALSRNGLRGQLLRGGIGSGGVKAAGTVLSLVVSVVLARNLGAAGYGIYSYVFALITFLTIPAQFGLPQLVVRETARAQSSSDWSALRGIWCWALLIMVVSSAGLAVLGGGAAWVASAHFSPVQLETFAWGLALLPVLVMARLGGAALRGLRHVVAGLLPDTVLRPGLLVLFVLALSLGAGDALTADSAMALHVGATALAVVVATITLRRVRPPEAGFAPPRFEHGAWGRAVLPLGLTASMMLINRHADILLLGLFVDAERVGVYRVAAQAAMLVAFGLQTVNLVAAPQFARMHDQGDRQRLQRLATGCARASLAVALPAALVFILFGEWLLRFLVGVEYVGGASALAILAVGHLVSASMGSVGLLLNMTDHEGVVTRTVALAAGGNILANLAFIPVWGMNGAAVATAITFVVWNVLLMRAVNKRLGFDSTALTPR